MAKKKFKKKSHSAGSDNIKLYLNKLGIKRTKNEFGEDYWKEIRNEGINPDLVKEEYGPFSEYTNDMYFLTESISQKTLSYDYDRIYSAIKSLKELNGFPPSPKNICELGGGAGPISLWISQKFLDSNVVVFDQSKNPLKIGEKWAEDLELINIAFVKKTYRELSEDPCETKFGFVLAVNAVELDIPPSEIGFIENSKHIDINKISEIYINPIETFVKACKNLVEETGVIYINPGSANELGLLVLFDIFRRNDLGIDWFFTIAKNSDQCGKKCSEGGISELHLFVRPSFPSILKSSWEDVRTTLLTAQWHEESNQLKPTEVETYLELLSTGIKILSVSVEFSEKICERFLIYIKAGMLGFFRIRNDHVKSGMIHSAASALELVLKIKNELHQNNLKILDEYYHPEIQSLLSKSIFESN